MIHTKGKLIAYLYNLYIPSMFFHSNKVYCQNKIQWRDSTDCSAAALYPADPGSNLVVSTLLQRVISDSGIFNPDTRNNSAGFDFDSL